MVKSVIALAEDGIKSHDATEAMDEAEIGFSYIDPVIHQTAFLYFRKAQPSGTKWGNWSDALDAIQTYTAWKFENQAFNFSVKSMIKGSTVGGNGKLVGLPEHIEIVRGTRT